MAKSLLASTLIDNSKARFAARCRFCRSSLGFPEVFCAIEHWRCHATAWYIATIMEGRLDSSSADGAIQSDIPKCLHEGPAGAVLELGDLLRRKLVSPHAAAVKDRLVHLPVPESFMLGAIHSGALADFFLPLPHDGTLLILERRGMKRQADERANALDHRFWIGNKILRGSDQDG